MEKTVIRQFLERKGELLRFYVNTPHVVTDTRALAPYADQQVVKSTENIQLPDISPLEPDISFKVKYVYNDQVNFPLKVRARTGTTRSIKWSFSVVNMDK